MIPRRRTSASRRQSAQSPQPATRPERCISSPAPSTFARYRRGPLNRVAVGGLQANLQTKRVNGCHGRFAMRYTYTGIEVKDLDRSIAFYRDAVGMEYLGRHKIEATGGEVAALRSKGSEHVLELNWYPTSTYREGSELDHLAFECEDVERETRRLLSAGATLARPVEVRPKYVVAFVKGPDEDAEGVDGRGSDEGSREAPVSASRADRTVAFCSERASSL